MQERINLQNNTLHNIYREHVLFNTLHLVPTAPISCYTSVFLCGQSPISHPKSLMIQVVKASLALIHIQNIKNFRPQTHILGLCPCLGWYLHPSLPNLA